MKYKIFLDTNIYCASHYDFTNENFLYLLKCESDGRIEFYINKIVEKEVIKHIKLDYDNFKVQLKKFKKEIKLAKSYIHNYNCLDNFAYDESFVINVFKDYLKKIHAKHLSVDSVLPSEIFNDYFDNKSPFESCKNKKNEFPDAFIVKSINKVNKDDEFIFVSNDKGALGAFNGSENRKFSNIYDLCKFLIKEHDEITAKEYLIDYCKKHYEEVSELIEVEFGIDNVILDGSNYDEECVDNGHDYYDYDICGEKLLEIYYDDITVEKKEDNNYCAYVKVKVEFEMKCLERDEEESYWDSEEKEYIIEKINTFIEEHVSDVDCYIYFRIDNDIINIQKCEIAKRVELNQYTRKDISICKDIEECEEYN